MKKFKAIVTKTYEYEIEIDDKVWTDENIIIWESVFQPVNNLEDVVEKLALMKTRYENGEFMEGFGIPYINGKAPHIFEKDRTSITPDININIVIDGDYDPDVEVKEIE